MDTVGNAFLSVVIHALFDRMESPAVSGHNLPYGPNKHFKKLRKLLKSVNEVLDCAEDNQLKHTDVKEWLDELKNVVYDVEDILDEIESRRKLDVVQTTTRKVRDINSASVFAKEIKEKILEAIYRLDHLEKQKKNLGLIKRSGGKVKCKPSERLYRTALVEDSGIFGLVYDKEKIVNLLLDDDEFDNEMRAIAIVGPRGIGKTTLAQLAYNDHRVKDHFDLKVWVCVSEEFDVFKVSKTILEGICCSTFDIKDLDGLRLTLKENLTGKKFLLVLDDVWNQNYADWEVLSNPFRSRTKGSRVIVTTPSRSVATVIRPIEIYSMEDLPKEDCWSLFAKHAFPDDNSDVPVYLEVYARQIVLKCGGIPLAVKTIGALLSSKRDIVEWKMINNELEGLGSVDTCIHPTLALSYKYLPSHLKRCFAYCSIFPKDYFFNKDELILLWMAEGFIQESGNDKTMEEVGSDYFVDLLSRSFFQQSIINESYFVMHDLIHDLAKLMCGESSIMLKVDYSGGLLDRTHHLSYLSTRFDILDKFKALYETKGLRTFLALNMLSQVNYLAKEVTVDLLPKLSCLRVLSLSHYANVTELPESIGEIKLLRYLNFSFTAIKRLPDSICKLYNLQTLKLFRCQSLAALPRDMSKLTNLRHLDISEAGIEEMPMQLSKLEFLQTLTEFIISKHCGPSIAELGKLENLRGKLSISGLENVELPKDALHARLKDKKYLEELSLGWNALDPNDVGGTKLVLENLRSPTNLRSLMINGYCGKKFPGWIGDPLYSNVTTLRLYKCKHCDRLPPLGQLPSLQNLSIVRFDRIVSVGPEFYDNGNLSVPPFRALKFLSFEHIMNWEEWFSLGPESVEAFPNLRELCIENCPKLTRGLPIHLSSLSKLVINKCLQLVASLPRAPAICELWLTHCNGVLLNELPTGMQKLVVAGFDALESLPEGQVGCNSCLLELRISYCSSLMNLSKSGLTSKLKTLEITFCEKLELPMQEYPSLQRLLLTYSCDCLRSIELDYFPKLYEIKICGCRNLESLGVSKQSELELVALEIDIRNCPNFLSFPEEGLHAPNLTSLCVVNCGSLRLLPEKMHVLLPSLEKLCIEDCPEIVSFPEGGLPSNLKEISINGCDKLVASRMGRGLQRPPSFK